jgi:murein DD-endopeptidase MepM/ murein hydrolase activator NlpD
VVLRIGSYGAQVRDLQRELRRRGIKVTIDGAYGPATKRAVKKMQRRLKVRRTGVADGRLLRRLGLRVRTTAGATTPVRPRIAPGASPYLDVFPVNGEYTFSADFGAARHQGSHQGVDIMADRGTPIVAVVNARVQRLARAETGLGGIYVWLRRADGTEYYYAHMNSIAAGLAEGSAVGAGQVVGTVGNTGDARYGAPHLHFEIRPGGSPTDPYPHLVAVDPTARR